MRESVRMFGKVSIDFTPSAKVPWEKAGVSGLFTATPTPRVRNREQLQGR
jgi:hypothetical protein